MKPLWNLALIKAQVHFIWSILRGNWQWLAQKRCRWPPEQGWVWRLRPPVLELQMSLQSCKANKENGVLSKCWSDSELTRFQGSDEMWYTLQREGCSLHHLWDLKRSLLLNEVERLSFKAKPSSRPLMGSGCLKICTSPEMAQKTHPRLLHGQLSPVPDS